MAIGRVLQNKPLLRKLDLHENVIRDKGTIAIIKDLFFANTPENFTNYAAAELTSSLTHLNLGSNDIGAEGALLVCKLLQHPQCTLRTLILGSEPAELYANKFDWQVGAELAKSLAMNNTLQVLDLNRCTMIGRKNQEAFKQFAKTFETNKSLSCLRLGDTSLTTPSAITLLETFVKYDHSNLVYLDLSSNQLQAEVCLTLSRFLAREHLCNLSTLLLQKNCLKSRGVAMICGALKNNTILTVLDLEENDIGNDGATSLAELLQTNQTITYLNVRNNNIDQIGCKAFFEAVQVNPVISTVIFSNNKIKDDGAKIVAQALDHHPSLRHLDLTATGFSDRGAVALALALPENKSLISLKIGNNHLSANSGKAFSEILERNEVLTSIDVKGNQIDHSTYLRMKKTLTRNKTSKMLTKPNKLEKEVIRLKYTEFLFHEKEHSLKEHKMYREKLQAQVNEASNQLDAIKKKGEQARSEVLEQIQSVLLLTEEHKLEASKKQAELDKIIKTNREVIEAKEELLQKEVGYRESIEKDLEQLAIELDRLTNHKEEEIQKVKDDITKKQGEKKELQEKIKKVKKDITVTLKKIGAIAEQLDPADVSALENRLKVERGIEPIASAAAATPGTNNDSIQIEITPGAAQTRPTGNSRTASPMPRSATRTSNSRTSTK